MYSIKLFNARYKNYVANKNSITIGKLALHTTSCICSSGVTESINQTIHAHTAMHGGGMLLLTAKLRSLFLVFVLG